jgi:cytochrome c-type biogenesis protein CcmH/NrfG
LAEAARLEPNLDGIHTQLAAVWLRLARMPEFFDAINHALRSNSSDVNALRLLAKGQMETGQFYESARVWHRLLTADPADKEALQLLGKCFFALEEFQMARMVYERILQLFSGDAIAAENLRVVARRTMNKRDQDDNPEDDVVVLAV